jgi:hypothetical protein
VFSFVGRHLENLLFQIFLYGSLNFPKLERTKLEGYIFDILTSLAGYQIFASYQASYCEYVPSSAITNIPLRCSLYSYLDAGVFHTVS